MAEPGGNTEISISVLLRLSAEAARKELTSFAGDLRSLGISAGEVGGDLASAGSAMVSLGAGGESAAQGISGIASAMASTSNATVSGAQAAETAIAGLSASTEPLQVRFADIVRSASGVGASTSTTSAIFMTAAEAAQSMTTALSGSSTAMQSALAATEPLNTSISAQTATIKSAIASEIAWQAELDQTHAKFDPLFAAQLRYKEILSEIDTALEQGALNETQAAAARQRAAATMQTYNSSLHAAGGYTANLFAQWNDIGLMMAAGQNPFMLAMQQGTQVSQVLMQMGGGTAALKAVGSSMLALLNPISLLSIGIIGFGAAGVQALRKLGGETRSFDDNLKDLDATLTRMKSNLGNVQNLRLDETFGIYTDSVRGLSQQLLILDRAAEFKQLNEVMKTFAKEDLKPGIFTGLFQGMGYTAGPIPGVTASDIVNDRPYAEQKYRDLGAANSYADFQARVEDLGKSADAGNIDEVISKLQDLAKAMSGGSGVSKMKKELRDLLSDLSQSAMKTAALEAAWNGSAVASANKRRIDDMARGWQQQADLSAVILTSGENSLAVEQKRADQQREALDLRLKEMKVVAGSADDLRARAALEAKIAADAEMAEQKRQNAMFLTLTGMTDQIAVSEAIIANGEKSSDVENLRTQQAQETLRIKLEEQGYTKAQIDLAVELLAIDRKRAQEARQAEADRKAGFDLGSMRAQAAINEQIARYGENSLEVKRAQIEASRREYEESLRTQEISKQTRDDLLAQWDRTNGLGATDPFGLRAAAREMLAQQQKSIAQAQLELSLVGQTEEVRRRTLALFQAELEIRQKNIDAAGAEAEAIRNGALSQNDLARSLEKQTQAWDTWRQAGESAVDSVFDKMKKGDLNGILDDAASAIVGGLEQLAITNPLKNALFGSDYATITDVGGLGGIWDRLTGKTPQIDPTKAASDAATQAMRSVATMQVTAATVIIGGAGTAQLSGSAGFDRIGAANSTAAPIAANSGSAPLGGSSAIQSQIWNFFSAKGLAPHQIAGIMGNIAGESGFNPLAKGDGGTSYGLFQHHASRADGLLSAVGGEAGLGNVQGQLDYAWRELNSTHAGALSALKSAPDVASATNVWMRQFENPSDAAMQSSWSRRMSSAEQALTKFTSTTATASTDLGSLGQGFNLFGNSLAQGLSGLMSGGAGGGFSGFFGTFASGLAHSAGIPGFARGGETGGSDPSKIAGVVHEREYVFDAASTSRIGVANLEALRRGTLRGYATGGYVAPVAFSAPAVASGGSGSSASSGPIRMVVNNYGSDPVVAEETTDDQGGRQITMTIGDAVAAAATQRGNPARRALDSAWQPKNRVVRR